jgi:methylated-DNA-[protein]-cysteine S-methyltransferase
MTPAPNLVLMHHTTPLGRVILAATDRGLAGLWFDDQRHLPDLTGQLLVSQHALLSRAATQLDCFFASHAPTFDLPLDLSAGTPFQQQVWNALLDIPAGHTCRYRDVAERIGRPTAVRAVGAAVGRNPISMVVPCHRVLGSNGQLTGYAGGLGRKRQLLMLEAAL